MKRTTIVFLSAVLLVGCGGADSPEDPQFVQVEGNGSQATAALSSVSRMETRAGRKL